MKNLTVTEIKTFWDQTYKMQINKKGCIAYVQKKSQDISSKDMLVVIKAIFDDYKTSTLSQLKQSDTVSDFALYLNTVINY